VWENFKSMPTLLKFLTAHAIACVALLLGSVIPHDSFSVNGHAVSYAVWWSSGVGPFASLVGVVGPIVGVLLLRKSPHARLAYLGFLLLGLIVPYPLFGSPLMALAGAAAIGVAVLYLYKLPAVQTYFAP